MKNLFDQPTRSEVVARISLLNNDSKPQWGQMTAYQMIRHCSKWDHMLLGKTLYKQSLLGKIVGKFALKDMMKDEPAKRNLPTVPSFKITEEGDITAAKKDWLDLIALYDNREPAGFIHPFFGKLTADQAGKMAYKHMDHHLRQFSV